jgi:hypothetical protein
LLDYRGGYRLLNGSAIETVINAPQTDYASNVKSAPLWEQARDVETEKILAGGLNNYAMAPGFYEDATFLRFRELSLTYTLPPRLTRIARLHDVSLTAAVRNLALWTRYTGVDPETTNSAGNNYTQGSGSANAPQVLNNYREDTGSVPLPRYWVFRLNIGL